MGGALACLELTFCMADAGMIGFFRIVPADWTCLHRQASGLRALSAVDRKVHPIAGQWWACCNVPRSVGLHDLMDATKDA